MGVILLAHPQGDEFLLPLHASLPQCVSSLDNRNPVLYSVAQKIKQLFFFPP